MDTLPWVGLGGVGGVGGGEGAVRDGSVHMVVAN